MELIATILIISGIILTPSGILLMALASINKPPKKREKIISGMVFTIGWIMFGIGSIMIK